jgi:hypothetical protein
MQSIANAVSNHRASRTGQPLQQSQSPRSAISASSAPRLSALAPATPLSLPSLANVPSSYEYYDGDARLFALLRRLSEHGMAATEPMAIRKLRTSPLAYVEASLASWVQAHGGDKIDGNIDYYLAISSESDEWVAEANGNSPLLITAEAVACGYMVAGAAIGALEAEAKGLGLTFYRVLAASLAKWMRVYDYFDARCNVEKLEEWRDMEDEGHREQYEIPDVESAIPTFLRKARLKVMRSDFSRLRKHQSGKFGTWIRRLLDMYRLGQGPVEGDVREVISSYYEQSCLPSQMIVFHKNDAIQGCFDEESDHWLEASSEPCFAVGFDPADIDQTTVALRSLETFLHLNRELCLLTEDFNKFADSTEASGRQPGMPIAAEEPNCFAAVEHAQAEPE